MLSDINIYCQPFTWAGNTELKDVNFFSSVAPSVAGTTIDLKDYMSEDSSEEFVREFSHILQDAKSSKYFHKAPNFDITVSGLMKSGSQSIYDYFRIFKDNTFVRFKVQLYYDGALIEQFVIYPDGITYEDPDHEGGTDTSSKVISLDAVGFIKEWAEYFKSNTLPAGSGIPFELVFNDNGEDVKAINFITLLLYVFNNTPISTPLHIADWMSVYDGTFQFHPDSHGLFFVPVGYVQIQRHDVSCYDYLEKICNGMGWIFLFSYASGLPALQINDLASATTGIPTFTLSSDKIIGVPRINAEGIQNRAKYICIPPHADLTGGDDAFYGSVPNLQLNKALKGAHDIYVSKDSFTELNGYHFSLAGTSGGGYALTRSTNLRVMKFREIQGDSKLYEILKWNGTAWLSSLIYIKQGEVLNLETGHNTRFKRKVDFLDRTVSASEEGDTIDDEHLVFSGCYASSLFKYQAVAGDVVKYQYSNINTSKSYIHSALFLNNMRALFNSYSRTYAEVSFALDTATMKQLLTNPLHYIRITGNENADLNKLFAVQKARYNVFDNSVTYSLVQKENPQLK